MSANHTDLLLRLFDETASLFHRLRAVAAEVHGLSEESAGRRGLLRSLDRLGPQTVPQLARARPVSRQYIQVLVSGLLEDSLVVAEDNPAHRRSPLVRLTPKGKRHLQTRNLRWQHRPHEAQLESSRRNPLSRLLSQIARPVERHS